VVVACDKSTKKRNFKKRKMTESTGNILAIDIGGSHIKGTILDSGGKEQTEYRKLPTPALATPEVVMSTIGDLVKDLPAYDKISVGFPGYVRNGVVFTAPNLGNEHWEKIDLGQRINDADQLGLGVVSGKGYELAITLGTGVGTAILIDGILLPHLELSHHPISKGRDYDEYLGSKALQEAGKEKWNKRVAKMLAVLRTVFNYDRLYLGGGSCKELNITMGDNIHLFNNQEGIKGGAKLWELEEKYHITTNYPQ
jgi:polyphosphate glucokinase